MTFQEAWDAKRPGVGNSQENFTRLRWQDLLVPLPELKSPARAYALTYRVHQGETRLDQVFSFEKRGVAESASAPIQRRAALDYEAEIALLLHRNEPDRFGFLFANDLTDRAIQIHTFDQRNPSPGFAQAKSFPGALRAGPLLVVGDATVWPKLELTLEVNGELRQQVKAHECLLSPRGFHQEVFARADIGDWALVLTGTAGGTIFQSPTFMQKFTLLLQNGFSKKRAREAWLRRFRFLQAGDQLEMKSTILGTSHATIVAHSE